MGIKRAAALALLLCGSAAGQCAICYRTAQALSAARGRVLNSGILILGAPPVLLLAGFVFWVRKRENDYRK
jgi:LPXTG-motif cell wall-anchored protein